MITSTTGTTSNDESHHLSRWAKKWSRGATAAWTVKNHQESRRIIFKYNWLLAFSWLMGITCHAEYLSVNTDKCEQSLLKHEWLWFLVITKDPSTLITFSPTLIPIHCSSIFANATCHKLTRALNQQRMSIFRQSEPSMVWEAHSCAATFLLPHAQLQVWHGQALPSRNSVIDCRPMCILWDTRTITKIPQTEPTIRSIKINKWHRCWKSV